MPEPSEATQRPPAPRLGSVWTAEPSEVSRRAAKRGDGSLWTPDREVAAIAAKQRGRVSLAQLRGAGMTKAAVAERVARGQLHPVYRGVYAVGHLADVPLGRETAALLACGEGAVLSHRTAAAMWRLLDVPTEVDVVVERRRRPRHEGIRVHRPAALEPRDVRLREGLRVTSPLRTIADLARVLSLDALDRVVSEALVLRLVTAQELEAVGGPKLRAVVGVARPTRNAAERQLLALIRRAGLPMPEVNVRVGRWEVDFLWREQGVAVELDGFQAHGHRRAFDRDRRKDLALRRHGLWPIRVGWRQLADTPEAVVADLARLTARRGG